jgi:hypothetical protein
MRRNPYVACHLTRHGHGGALRRMQNDARTRIRPLKSENSEEGKVIERFCKKRQATASEIPQGMVMDQLPYHGQCNHRGKVFGVGVFKTGTSSLSRELSDLGYTPCAQARGFFLFGGAKLKYYFFDGPVMRQAIQADPEMRRDLRAVVNMTLSAADGPWLFYHKASERERIVLSV